MTKINNKSWATFLKHTLGVCFQAKLYKLLENSWNKNEFLNENWLILMACQLLSGYFMHRDFVMTELYSFIN